MNVTSLENRVFADVNELNKVELIKVGLNPMTCVLRKRPCEGIEMQRYTRKRTLSEGGDRNWSDGSTNQGKPRDIRCPQPPEPRREAKNRFSFRVSSTTDTLILDFWPPKL